jgi:hypothetical protein
LIVEGLALSAALAFAAPSSTSSIRVPVSPQRQEILTEMRARRILPAAANAWKPADEILLARMRQAEASGALDLLKKNLGTLQGFAIWHRVGADRSQWLTKAGYDKYLFFRSQQARAYFEEQDTPSRVVFQIKNIQGEELFDSTGLLTSAGEELYNRILRGEKVRWVAPSGQVMDNAPFRSVSGDKK